MKISFGRYYDGDSLVSFVRAPGGTYRLDDVLPDCDPLNREDRDRVRERLGNGRNFRKVSGSLNLAAPLSPSFIMNVGLNYRKHAEESGMAPPEHPVFFGRNPSSVVGPGADIVLPEPYLPGAEVQLDYEVELGVWISRRCYNVTEEEAMSYVAGASVCNDVSERTRQLLGPQWLPGKSLPTSCPVGPWFVPTEDIGSWDDLELTLSVNGELRQRDKVAGLLHPISRIVSYASRTGILEAGTFISTGTPSGCVLRAGGREPVYAWLKAGDSIELEIASDTVSLGIQRQRVVPSDAGWDDFFRSGKLTRGFEFQNPTVL